jgi:chemotaxis methyl-accepting protein methylase
VSVFDLLRDCLIPTIAGTRRSLHAWSAGCSDGAELYSLALLLAEVDMLDNSYLLGTDCRSDALERARSGYFDCEAVKQVPAPLLTRYFRPQGRGYQVVAQIRAAVHWRTGDVLMTPEPGVWDLILCRNTAMYIRAEATKLLWEQFEKRLRPGGMLVLGKAERPVGAKRLSPVGPCVYRRNRG